MLLFLVLYLLDLQMQLLDCNLVVMRGEKIQGDALQYATEATTKRGPHQRWGTDYLSLGSPRVQASPQWGGGQKYGSETRRDESFQERAHREIA